VDAERVDPEIIGLLGIARGNVAGNSFIESESREQAETRCEAFFAVPAFFADGSEDRGCGDIFGSSWGFDHMSRIHA
jgi:hypothetical protein